MSVNSFSRIIIQIFNWVWIRIWMFGIYYYYFCYRVDCLTFLYLVFDLELLFRTVYPCVRTAVRRSCPCVFPVNRSGSQENIILDNRSLITDRTGCFTKCKGGGGTSIQSTEMKRG